MKGSIPPSAVRRCARVWAGADPPEATQTIHARACLGADRSFQWLFPALQLLSIAATATGRRRCRCRLATAGFQVSAVSRPARTAGARIRWKSAGPRRWRSLRLALLRSLAAADAFVRWRHGLSLAQVSIALKPGVLRPVFHTRRQACSRSWVASLYTASRCWAWPHIWTRHMAMGVCLQMIEGGSGGETCPHPNPSPDGRGAFGSACLVSPAVRLTGRCNRSGQLPTLHPTLRRVRPRAVHQPRACGTRRAGRPGCSLRNPTSRRWCRHDAAG